MPILVDSPRRHSHTAWFWVLFALVGAIFFVSVDDYYLFDDFANLVHAREFQSFNRSTYYSWLEAIFSNSSGPTGRPVAMLTFAINASGDSGLNAQALKLTNVILHLLCGILAFAFVKSLLTKKDESGDKQQVAQLAALAAILWIISPIHVSTVLYPVQRMTQLSSIFTLGGLLIFLHFRSRLAVAHLPVGVHFRFYTFFVLALVLAAFSKENGVLLLWYAALVEVSCFQGRWAGKTVPALGRLALVLVVMPSVVLLSVTLINASWFESWYSNRNFSMWERVLTQSRVVWSYLDWILFPSNEKLAIFHDGVEVSSSMTSPLSTLPAIGFLLIAIVVLMARFRKLGLVSFGVFFFLIGHSIESTIVPLEMVFEHRNYLPSLGITICLAFAIAYSSRRLSRQAQVGLASLILLFYVLVLSQRLIAWSDQVWQAEEDFASHPDSPRTLYLLARAYEGSAEELLGAERELERSLILAARELYKRQQVLDDDAVAPVVLQYFLEVQYLTGSPTKGILLERMSDLAKEIHPSASDANALESLMECGLNGICSEDIHAITEISEQWALNPKSGFSGQLWQYKLRSGWMSQEERVLSLDALVEQHPFSRELRYLHIARAASQGDMAAAFSDLVSLYEADRRKLSVLELKRILGE